MTGTTAETLGAYTARLRFDDLPAEIVSQAKALVLDSLGCTLGGHVLPPGQLILDMVQSMGGRGRVRVAGTSIRLPTPWAVYANAYLSNVLDFDDVHPVTGHPGATIIPPALALAQEYPCSGREFIAAIVASYEVVMRIGNAIQATPEQSQRVVGFATWQIFGASTVAAKLMRQDERTTANTLAVAATHAPVPFVRKSGRHDRPYAWVKNNYGWTAMGGYLAAWQSSQGFRGNLTVFDGDTGFWRMAGSDRCMPEQFVEGLGETYQITQVGLKPYPMCRHMHAAIDTLDIVMKQQNLRGAEIARVEVYGSPSLAEDFIVYRPVDIIDAQFSLPWAMAMILLDRKPGYAWLDPSLLADPAVEQQARKVVAFVEQPLASQARADWPARVVVRCNDGRVYERGVSTPLGHECNPLSPQQRLAKFLDLRTPVLGSERSRSLADRIVSLDHARDLAWLARWITPPK
jgi:2-methylcitrate dehydratase PrpD